MYNINLKSLPYVTAQEVFDQIAYGMLRQMKVSTNKAGACVYRGKNGTKCAAGMIMDDSEAEKITNLDLASYDYLVQLGEAPKEHSELIYNLQKIHDSVGSPWDWHNRLKKFAKKNKLEFDF